VKTNMSIMVSVIATASLMGIVVLIAGCKNTVITVA